MIKSWKQAVVVCGFAGSALLTACSSNQQIGGYHQMAFEITPKCGETLKTVVFKNSSGAPMQLLGAAFSAGTNGDSNFKIKSLKLGTIAEPILSGTSGGFNAIEIPKDDTYALSIAFTPSKVSSEVPLRALIDLAFSEPAGVIQLEVAGFSEGEVACSGAPSETPGEVGIVAGSVGFKILQLIAATPQVTEPLNTEAGKDPFTPVTVPGVTLLEGEGNAELPQITDAINLLIPQPDSILSPNLAGLVKSDTHIVSADAVSGTYAPETGTIALKDLKVTLTNKESKIELTLPDLTTESIEHTKNSAGAGVSKAFLDTAGIANADGKIFGCPLKKDGSVILISMAKVDLAKGKLAAAQGRMAVLIRAKVLCTDETSECGLTADDPDSFLCGLAE